MEREELLVSGSDPRATLGVRPGARPGRILPKLAQLQTNVTDRSPRQSLDSRPPSPRTTQHQHLSVSIPGTEGDRSISLGSASTNTAPASAGPSAFGGDLKRRRRPTLAARKHQPADLTANSGQYETQKLLGHLLDRLETRRKGPDLLARAAANARELAAHQAKGKNRVAQIGGAVAAVAVRSTAATGKALVRTNSEDMDDHPQSTEDGDWDTDAVYDLLEQARSLLVLADRQGMDVFAKSGVAAADAATKLSRNKAKHRPSRFASISGHASKPKDGGSVPSAPETSLIRRLVTVLRSLIMTDCMYTTRRFRLTKPPFALQAMALDIAAILYHKGDLGIKLDTMNVVIDALYTVGEPMRLRTCQWLEGRMGEMLRRLSEERGTETKAAAKVEWSDPFAESPAANPESPSIPTFAFSGPEDPAVSPPVTKGWMRFSPVGSPGVHWPVKLAGVLSTHATDGVTTAAMQIAALVPRMMVAITSTIELTASSLDTIHAVHRLLSLILTAKPDSGLDLLEIVAHGPPSSRRGAMDILATYFPQAVGHNVIARRPALTTYQAHREKWETGTERALLEDDTEGHYYIPWRGNPEIDFCVACNQSIQGFCVKCTLCSDCKHFYCLSLPMTEVFDYDVSVLSSKQQQAPKSELVQLRFSLVPLRLDEQILDSGESRGTSNATVRKMGQHRLHLCNLFTLTLCDECGEPLWGAACQAYVCVNQCQRLYHPACVDAMLAYKDPRCQAGQHVYVNPEAKSAEQILDPFTITAESIHSSFARHKNKLCYNPEDLREMSYDEVAYLYANIWIQHEIYLNGISVGTLRLLDVPIEDDITGIALLLTEYEKRIYRDLPHSPAMIDFANVSVEKPLAPGFLLWDTRFLQYCAALIRAPPAHHDNGSTSLSHVDGGLLTVGSGPPSPDPSVTESPVNTYEQVPMAVVRESLSQDLHLRDDLAAATLIQQLRQFGLVSVANRREVDTNAMDDNDIRVGSSLPMLMDSSPAVELLVLAIEQLLDDIDLTANEQGFSLLVKLAWPSSMCSPYAMARLGGAVMSWIMDEDDVLHLIVKDYASKSKRPPGVRNAPGQAARGTAAVAAYKEDRGRLLQRYARPWLEALCHQDSDAYTDLAYERSKVFDHRYDTIDLPKGDEAGAKLAGLALERITTLADTGVMFQGSLDLLTFWLEDLGALIDSDVVYKPLPRLLRHANSQKGSDVLDIWELSLVTSQETEGFERVCRWLRALTFSGVVVPWSIITSMVDKHSVGESADESLFNLVIAVDANTAPIEADRFAELCNNIFIPLAVSMSMRNDAPSAQDVEMLRISMLSLLKAYGTTTDSIAETSLSSEGKAKVLASHARKKQIGPPNSGATLDLHSEVIFAAARILPQADRPCDTVLDFLWLLFAKADSVHNVKGFLYEICPDLYEFIWPLYGRSEVNRKCRARVFLKLLTINHTPIEEQVVKALSRADKAVTREMLLEFVLELADETITLEVQNWRRHAVGLIMLLFDVALKSNEPVPETLVIWKGILPSQLQAITQCFEEYLESSPDEQRQQLIAKLLRLRVQLPSWQIIGWDTLEQLVTEQVGTIAQNERSNTTQAHALASEAWTIRASLLALGLNMLEAGVACAWMVLQRFQQHVAAACAQPWPTPSEPITSIVLPALKNVLDSTARTSVVEGTGRAKETTLVGALFVSIVINFASDLGRLDFVVQRYILDILLVVYFKHNVQPYELSALSTLQTLATFAADTHPAENRLLALQVLQTAQAHMPKDRFSRVLPALFVGVADILFKETRVDGDSALIDACREFLQASITEFGKAGLFLQVLRTDGQESAGNCAPEAIGRAMQEAARLEGSNKNVWLDQVIIDLPEVLRWRRDAMAQVFPSLARLSLTMKDGLTGDSALSFGAFLSRLGKQASEWDNPESLDLNPVLQTCTALLKICPVTEAGTLLHQISSFLHVLLLRYAVQLDQIRALVPVSIKVARQQQTENTVVDVLFDGCAGIVRGTHGNAVTLKSLLDWLADDKDVCLKKERLGSLVDTTPGCAAILMRLHPTISHLLDADMTLGVLKSAATVIVRAEIESSGNTGRVLRSLPREPASTQLDVFAHVLFASLDVRLGDARSRLMSLYPVLSRAAALSLYACADLLSVPDVSGNGAHLASAAFVVMRLAVLAVQDPTPEGLGTFTTSVPMEAYDVLVSFWHRLWPEWDRLLGLSLASSCVNLPQRAVTLSVLMDIVLFISAIQPSLLVEPAPTLARGLTALEEWHNKAGTTVPGKLGKTVAALEAGALRIQPAFSARRMAKNAVWADMLATERLLTLQAQYG